VRDTVSSGAWSLEKDAAIISVVNTYVAQKGISAFDIDPNDEEPFQKVMDAMTR
jgi:hypothetical protein